MIRYPPVSDVHYSVSMNSLPATDVQPVTNSSGDKSSYLTHNCEFESENSGNGNKVVPSYESATSNILDIFSTGEVTKAQNGDFQRSDSELLLFLDISTQNSLSQSMGTKKCEPFQPSDQNDHFWSLIDPLSVDDKTEAHQETRRTNHNTPTADALLTVTDSECDLAAVGVNYDTGVGGEFRNAGSFHTEEENVGLHLQQNIVINDEAEEKTFDLLYTPPFVNDDIPDLKQASIRNQTMCDSNDFPSPEGQIFQENVFGQMSSRDLSDLIPMLSDIQTDNTENTNQDIANGIIVSLENVQSYEENALDDLSNRMNISPDSSDVASAQAVANNSSLSQICPIISDLSRVNETTDELPGGKSELTLCQLDERPVECTKNLDTLIGKVESDCYWMEAAEKWQEDDREGADEGFLPEALQNVALSAGGDTGHFCGTETVDGLCPKDNESPGSGTVHLDDFSTFSVASPELGDVSQTAQSLKETKCATMYESSGYGMMSSPPAQDSGQPEVADSRTHEADSSSTIEDIYEEQSIYDLYRSDSEEDAPESHVFALNPTTLTHEGEDNYENCSASPLEINRCLSPKPDVPYLWGLGDIRYLFSEDESRENGCGTTESVDLQETLPTQTGSNVKTTDEAADDLQANSDEKAVPVDDTKQPRNDIEEGCETIIEVQSKPFDSIVHNPPTRKLRRNPSKADLLTRSMSLEAVEPPSPLVFSERFSKIIQEKLTREGLYDISKPVSVDEAERRIPETETSLESENDNTTNEDNEKLDNGVELSSTAIPVNDLQHGGAKPPEKTDVLLPSPRMKGDRDDDKCLYNSTTLCVERKDDRNHGVYTSTMYFQKRTVYGSPDGSGRSAECPRQGEKSIYDSYPAYDTDDDSNEKRLSFAYMERKWKTKNRLRIINKICKISSGKAQESSNRKPLKIFRGNPIC